MDFKPNLTRLTAEQLSCLGVFSSKEIQDSDKLQGAERKIYLQNAALIYSNPVFVNEIRLLIEAQKEFIACESEDYQQVCIGRGTINGLTLILERVEAFKNEYNSITKGEDPPVDDPSRVIGVVD
jgi:hypothetical protein